LSLHHHPIFHFHHGAIHCHRFTVHHFCLFAAILVVAVRTICVPILTGAEAGMEQIRDLVLTLARALVDNPERVKVNVIEGSNTYVFELSVAREDIGKIIGKQGRTANAIRQILASVSGRIQKRISLEVME
jgi:predicted RNA-binding protein YlqC (UPF0109 family)